MIQHSRDVIRVGRPLVLDLMTRITVSIHQLIVVVDVTLRALYRDVRSRQGELCNIVIK
jgi:hypothetical protein